MDEHDEDEKRDKQKHSWREERSDFGMSPPYGAYRGHYEEHEQLGSGRLGGWTGVGLGGSFDDVREKDPERDH
jgi:hypothetical protein